MFSALRDKELVQAKESRKEQGPFICPACAAPVLLKKGPIKAQHFAHLLTTGCERVVVRRHHPTMMGAWALRSDMSSAPGRSRHQAPEAPHRIDIHTTGHPPAPESYEKALALVLAAYDSLSVVEVQADDASGVDGSPDRQHSASHCCSDTPIQYPSRGIPVRFSMESEEGESRPNAGTSSGSLRTGFLKSHLLSRKPRSHSKLLSCV